MGMKRTAGAALAALLLLAGCGGPNYDDKTADGLARALSAAGTSAGTEPANVLRVAKEVCAAFDDEEGFTATRRFYGKPGEAQMRTAVAYVCPDHLEAWYRGIEILRG